MDIKLIIMIISGAVFAVGGFILMYNIYLMTLIDAKARGLKHPKLLGFLNISGNNGNGFLLMYLLMRKKYPLENMSQKDKENLNLLKKKSMLAMYIHLIGAIIFITCFILFD